MKLKILYSALFVVFVIDLILISLGKNYERLFTKPFLIPLLVGYYISELKTSKANRDISPNWLFLLGLGFSFLGDCFLLNVNFFDLGLASFLVAHLFYIFSFSKLKKTVIQWKIILLILLYLVLFLTLMYSYINDVLKIEISIYALTISAMLFFAIKTSEKYLILGALIFIVSDSILAIDNFVKPALLLKLLVMITYMTAQYLLVKGMIKIKQKQL